MNDERTAYNLSMTVLLWVGVWLLLGPPVLLLVVALCRAGHREDVARHYVDERPGPVPAVRRLRSRGGDRRPAQGESPVRTGDPIG